MSKVVNNFIDLTTGGRPNESMDKKVVVTAVEMDSQKSDQ